MIIKMYQSDFLKASYLPLHSRRKLSVYLKVKTSIGNAPISKNEMEALIITNHVKEYVLNNT